MLEINSDAHTANLRMNLPLNKLTLSKNMKQAIGLKLDSTKFAPYTTSKVRLEGLCFWL